MYFCLPLFPLPLLIKEKIRSGSARITVIIDRNKQIDS